MARWRLLEPHYLFTEPGTKWEYVETDRVTGRQVRKQYDVPTYFHHEAETDWNDYTTLANGAKAAGQVVVSDGHNPGPRDIIFKGQPTPGMDPLDDEARAITAKFRKEKWNIPDNIKWGAGEYSIALADHFVQQQDKVNMQMAKLEESRVQNTDKFQESMIAMMAQNQKILSCSQLNRMENQMAKKDLLEKIIADLQALSAVVGDVSDIEERRERAQADLDSLNQTREQALAQKTEAETLLSQAQKEAQRRFDQDMFNKQGQLKSLIERVAILQKQVAELSQELESKNGQLASVNGAMADARRRLMG